MKSSRKEQHQIGIKRVRELTSIVAHYQKREKFSLVVSSLGNLRKISLKALFLRSITASAVLEPPGSFRSLLYLPRKAGNQVENALSKLYVRRNKNNQRLLMLDVHKEVKHS